MNMRTTIMALSACLAFSMALQAQMIPLQSVKIEYDSRGNREIRKLWNPQTPASKNDESLPLIDEQSEGLEAYPNPATDWVTLSVHQPQSEPQTIELLNSTGQVVHTQSWLDQYSKARLNLEALPDGLYHIAVTDARGNRKTISIIHLR